MLALPASMTVHNVFHVSLLKKYIPDANHVIDWNVIQVEQEGILQVHHVRILDRKRKQLQNQTIGLVKVHGPGTVLRTRHGSMKMLCGQNTRIFLKILEILLMLCKELH
jgi:hypothetical protein